MNDYLKNQLVKENKYQQRYSLKNERDPAVEMLKMEIEYLQLINREKDLQI